MRFPSRLVTLTLALAVTPALGVGTARGDIIDIAGGTGEPGAFVGSVEVKHTPGGGTAQVIVTLTNTSPVANGGFITGFAFNNPASAGGGNITQVTGFNQAYDPERTVPPSNYMSLLGVASNGALLNNSISGAPYGNFDLGAAVGGSLLGGGPPQPGIEVGQTGTFTFTVTGTNLSNLTAESILGTASQGGTAAFIVRFRGFLDGSSDKIVIGTKVPGEPVPAPPAVVLAGLGLSSCLLGRSLRRTTGSVA